MTRTSSIARVAPCARRGRIASCRSSMLLQTLVSGLFSVFFGMVVQQAVAKNWVNAGSGDWSVPGNWSPASVPTAGEAVNIVFTNGVSRTVTYNVAAPAIGLLTIDLTNAPVGASTLSMPNNFSLTANGIFVGGYSGITASVTTGSGAMTQAGGTTTTPAGWDFVLGHGAASSGVYTLSGGALVANQSEYVGLSGNGMFNHSGGTNTIANASGFFILGTNAGSTGAYNLSGTGLLTVNDDVFVGYSGTGVLTQSGGTHNVGAGRTLYLGYNVSSGSGTYNLSAGTLSAPGVSVGYRKLGTFVQSGGINNASIAVGIFDGVTGTYTLSDGVINATYVTVGSDGDGTFHQTGGTSNIGVSLDIAYLPAGTGTYNLSGGSVTVIDRVSVGGSTFEEFETPGGAGILNVSGTGVLTSSNFGGLHIFNTTGTALNLSGGTINTPGLNVHGNPARFNWTGGTLNLTTNVAWNPAGGGTSAAFGAARVVGSGQTLMISGNESFSGGAFALTVDTGGTHHVTGTITLGPTGTITQNDGGTLYTAGFTQAGGTINGKLQNQTTFTYQSGLFNGKLWNQGTVIFTSLTTGNGLQNDTTMTLNAGQTLTTNGAGLDNRGWFTMNGGVLNSNAFVNSGTFLFDTGTLTVANGMTNEASGLLLLARNKMVTINGASVNSGELQLGGDASTIAGTGGLSNSGFIRGDGVLSKPLTNSMGGEVRAENAKRIKITGANGSNAGKLYLQGGTLEFTQSLTNDVDGQVIGRGTLIVSGAGLTNIGSVALSSGITDVFGDVVNDTGAASRGIAVSGNADATFWGDVSNTSGLFRVSSGSSVTFFGTFAGEGISGTGDVYFEADVSPGASPAQINFGGNLVLGGTATLNIEIGGTTPGTQYDRLVIAGGASLDGDLDVSLINDFTPGSGQQFTILTAGSIVNNGFVLTGPAASSFSLLVNSTSVILQAIGLAGDYNNNGAVDAADYVLWRNGGPLANEVDAPGTVNGADYTAWRERLGNPGSGSGGGSNDSAHAAVPEPATLLLLLFAAAGSCLWRCSRPGIERHCATPDKPPDNLRSLALLTRKGGDS